DGAQAGAAAVPDPERGAVADQGDRGGLRGAAAPAGGGGGAEEGEAGGGTNGRCPGGRWGASPEAVVKGECPPVVRSRVEKTAGEVERERQWRPDSDRRRSGVRAHLKEAARLPKKLLGSNIGPRGLNATTTPVNFAAS